MKKLLFLLLFICFSTQNYAQTDDSKLSHQELDSLVHTLYNQGELTQAIKFAKIGQAKRLQESSTKDSLYADYTAALGFFYHRLEQYTTAKKYYIEALALRRKLFGSNHSGVAKSINNLANLYRHIGDYKEAEKLLLESKAIREKIWGREHPKYATILNNLAQVYKEMYAYEKALPLILQSLAIRKKAQGKYSKRYAFALNNLAELYRDMGKEDAVEDIYLEVIDIWKTLGEEKNYNYSTSINNLGSYYRKNKNYDKAFIYLKQASELTAKALGKNNIKYATTLANRATLYADMKNYTLAEKTWLEAGNILLPILGNKHPITARYYNDIATLYLDTENYEKAKMYLYKSIQSNAIEEMDSISYEQLPKLNFVRLSTAILSLQHLLIIAKKKYEQSISRADLIAYYQLAQAGLILQDKSRYSLDADKDKLRVLKKTTFLDGIVWAASLLQEDTYLKSSFEAIEKNKSALLLELFQSKNALQLTSLPDSIVMQEKKLKKRLSTAKKEVYLSAKNDSTYQNAIENLSNVQFAISKLTKNIQENYPDYYNQKYQNIIVPTAEVQQLLDTKTVLLEYYISSQYLYVYVITKNSFDLVKIPLNEQQLYKEIKQFHQALSNYSQVLANKNLLHAPYIEIGHKLYESIVAPAIPNSEYTKLLIIPDKSLGYLPFESFLTSPVKQKISYRNLPYLLNKYTISYNYSATLWKENSNANLAKQNNGLTLGMAASYPVLDSSLLELRTMAEYQTRTELVPLPAAEKEVVVLSELLEGAFYSGLEANESQFKQEAANYQIIHLATHGILDKQRPMLSSLALTENNDSLENNFLQAYEIASMELHANLVVLSACETGFGKFEQGEGVMSLARSFMYAGVPSLVVSLWSVNDQSTAIIMQDFYKNLIKNMSKDEALRQAKLDYIQRANGVAAHPAFWSPFIQLGNSETITIQTKSNPIYWIIGVGSILILLLGFYIIQKRKKTA